ncbi:hypothetical protein ILYODFUR_012705 [Ilyodon furcidens]|uniref:Uncharacterized protein n=1 Tax=Ilyodon furcidens TaxID=33524 RepID=A0ABV0TBA7_9TELE
MFFRLSDYLRASQLKLRFQLNMDAYLAHQLNPSESHDDILNTPFIAETSRPAVIRQVCRCSSLRSMIIDSQSQHHSTTPSPRPHPEIQSSSIKVQDPLPQQSQKRKEIYVLTQPAPGLQAFSYRRCCRIHAARFASRLNLSRH